MCLKKIIKMLKAYYDNATNDELRDAVKAILNNHPLTPLLNTDGTKNWFKIDNYLAENLVPGILQLF